MLPPAVVENAGALVVVVDAELSAAKDARTLACELDLSDQLGLAGNAVDFARAVRGTELKDSAVRQTPTRPGDPIIAGEAPFGTEAASGSLQVLLLVNHAEMVRAEAAQRWQPHVPGSLESRVGGIPRAALPLDETVSDHGTRNDNSKQTDDLASEALRSVREGRAAAALAAEWVDELDVGDTVHVRHVCVRDRYGLQPALRSVFERVLGAVERNRDRARAR